MFVYKHTETREYIKGALSVSLSLSLSLSLSGLRQFSTTESPLKMMKNISYFTSKALFVLKTFKFLS